MDVISACFEEYLSSNRDRSSFADLTDTLHHVLSRIPHSFDIHTANLANSGVELPRNGVTGVSSSGVGSSVSHLESLLDELYVTQGNRNSHHSRIHESIQSGSSITNTHVTPQRFLSATCYRSLKDLCASEDPTLEAIMMEYRDLGGSSNISAYRDFLHSLLILSQRWKRYLFFKQDHTLYLRQSRTLFSILDDFLSQQLISFGEYDFIENVLYNLSNGTNDGDDENHFILAAWANCWESLQDSNCNPSTAVSELYDSILHLLENQIQLIYRRYTHEAINFLVQLNSNSTYRFPPATFKHLMRLVKQQEVRERASRSGVLDVSMSVNDAELDRQSTLLFACFAESAQTQQVYELIDSLLLIGNAWRKSSPHINLLECLRYIAANHLISESDCQLAELAVYDGNSFLLASWANYEEANYSKKSFDEFIENLRVCLEREFRTRLSELARVGYQLCNSWSVNPDPLPAKLGDDLVRYQVLGFQPIPKHTHEIKLPAELSNTLDVESSSLLRSLIASRDVVLMAILSDFVDSNHVDELIDLVERRIARAKFGSASMRPMHSSSVTRTTRSNAAINQSSEESLEIYQLSQMLLSLQQDGYLSQDTLVQLLYAVQERKDAVLLAAFSVYKGGLSSSVGESGWADLWDTLQRVWQRIQRDQVELTQAREAGSSGVHSFLAAADALLLRHIGSEVIDSLSAGELISITNTLYLRDLLRLGDCTLYAILSLAQQGQVDSNEQSELRESLTLLSQRWMKELDLDGRAAVRLLHSLSHSFSPSSLDYLLGLVYARDSTLAAAISLYFEGVSQEESVDTWSESDSDSDSQSAGSGESESCESECESECECDGQHSHSNAGRSESLVELCDSLRHILSHGNRLISAWSSSSDSHSLTLEVEDDFDAQAKAHQLPASDKNPLEYGLPYCEN